MGDAAAPLAEALQSAAAWAGQATNLGRPPTSPCWSLVVPTVAVATTEHPLLDVSAPAVEDNGADGKFEFAGQHRGKLVAGYPFAP